MSEQITKHSDTEIKVIVTTSKEEVISLEKINKELELITNQEASLAQQKTLWEERKAEAIALEVVEKVVE